MKKEGIIHIRFFLLLFSISVIWCGCSGNNPAENLVVVYTSADEPYSKPIFDLFTRETGIQVQAVYDAEASKTVGLANRLIAEKSAPKADVFWNSEASRTIVLKQKGVLQKYASPSAGDIPAAFKDPENYWTGFAARARILLCNTNLATELPSSVHDFTQERWKGRFAMANPLFGTSGTQVGAWYSLWGTQKAEQFLSGLKQNGAMIVNGNAQARDLVAGGEIPACLTDTDDAFEAISKGRSVKMIYPDQGEQGEGLLLIPNTVCLIAGCPHPENGRKLIDFLLSRKIEETLAHGSSAQIPLRSSVKCPPHVKGLADLKIQTVDYEKIATLLPESAAYIRDSFLK